MWYHRKLQSWVRGPGSGVRPEILSRRLGAWIFAARAKRGTLGTRLEWTTRTNSQQIGNSKELCIRPHAARRGRRLHERAPFGRHLCWRYAALTQASGGGGAWSYTKRGANQVNFFEFHYLCYREGPLGPFRAFLPDRYVHIYNFTPSGNVEIQRQTGGGQANRGNCLCARPKRPHSCPIYEPLRRCFF